MLVVEHNLEVIAAADWVIYMGPEAGDGGGRVVVEGPPEDVVIHAQRWRHDNSLLRSHTGEALDAFGLEVDAAIVRAAVAAAEPGPT